MRVYDNSLTPDEPLQPDFKVSTEIYQVENGQKFRLGDTDEYFWQSKSEIKKKFCWHKAQPNVLRSPHSGKTTPLCVILRYVMLF